MNDSSGQCSLSALEQLRLTNAQKSREQRRLSVINWARRVTASAAPGFPAEVLRRAACAGDSGQPGDDLHSFMADLRRAAQGPR